MSQDPGLLLVDKQGQAHVRSVELVVTLRPVTHDHPSKAYRQHSLVLYTDNGDHALLVESIPVWPHQPSKPFTFYVQVKPRAPSLLLCRWFAHAQDKESDSAWALEMVASGGSATGEEIMLLDVASKSQAVVDVKGWPWKEEKPSPKYTPHPLLAQVTRAVSHAYTKVPRKQPNDVFTQIHVHLGPVVRAMPVLFYTLVARRMKATPLQATAYFEHVTAIAMAMSSAPAAVDEQLLADMLTLPSLVWAYRPDKTRSLDEIDQWSSLWSYPPTPGGVVAFDCEDGSIALMQLFLVLQSVELIRPSKSLQRLQTLARRYTPWLAVNELLSSGGSAKGGVGGGNYVLHCCLLLLPSGGSGAVPISIESTARCSGPWRKEGGDGTYARDRARAHKAVARGSDRAIMHLRTPISVVHAHRMYGRLIALVSCESGRARHLLMEGVDTAAFLFGGGDVSSARVAVDIPLADLEDACARELQLTPTPRFPAAPRAAVVMPIPRDASVILPAFASADVRAACTQVHVTSDANLFVLSV